ncbi:MAG: hypothetical protein FJ100_18690 [Deltaproteobacteria bacterium]|nr:hypothetical protein [Deltaproteobacteria bacterium]
MELTREGDGLGVEEFYPYGDTAYWSQTGAAGFSRKRYRFNGKEKDEESGLYYYGARYYAAWLGRWTACDPAPAAGVSPFEFCSANPPSRLDPDGARDETVVGVQASTTLRSTAWPLGLRRAEKRAEFALRKRAGAAEVD